MGKMIFWLVVIFVILFVLRLVNVAATRSRRQAKGPKDKASDPAMTRCVDCGVYLPRADATPSARGPLCGDPQCLERNRRG